MRTSVLDAKNQLLDDFNKVIGDTESLLKSMASVPGDKAAALRASVQGNLDDARKRMRELQGVAMDKATFAAKATDEYVHENPWMLMGIAAAIGVVVGMMIASDRD
jgi:ElaB/YqjD/DUF883 family membrane-anchored ribosome-binding protein